MISYKGIICFFGGRGLNRERDVIRVRCHSLDNTVCCVRFTSKLDMSVLFHKIGCNSYLPPETTARIVPKTITLRSIMILNEILEVLD